MVPRRKEEYCATVVPLGEKTACSWLAFAETLTSDTFQRFSGLGPPSWTRAIPRQAGETPGRIPEDRPAMRSRRARRARTIPEQHAKGSDGGQDAGRAARPRSITQALPFVVAHSPPPLDGPGDWYFDSPICVQRCVAALPATVSASTLLPKVLAGCQNSKPHRTSR